MGKRKGLEHSAKKKALSLLNGKKSSKKAVHVNEDDVLDDVDLFHAEREHVLLNDARQGSEDEESGFRK